MKKQNIKRYSFCALFGALGFILMILEFSIPSLIPGFIKMDFSEIPAIITTFAYGPLYGVIVCFLKNLFHLFITTTGGVGELSNFILGAIFVSTAGLIYKYRKTRRFALIGVAVGAFIMAAVSVFTNYFIVYPIYGNLFFPLPAILSSYQTIMPSVNNLFEAILIFNFPFNLIKGFLDATICFLVYKKISPILK